MKTLETASVELQAAQTKLDQADPTWLGLVKSTIQLRQIADSGTIPLIIAFSEQKGEDRFDLGSTFRKVRATDPDALKAADILARIELTDDYKTACAEINPLMEALEKATVEANLASQRKSKALRDLAEAKQIADDKAQAQAAADPSVIKASKQLAIA